MLDLLRNRVLLVSLAGWAVAQALKVVIEVVTHRRLNFARLTGAGGMPSSHSSLVTALAVAVARRDGLASTPFAIAAVFAGVVMYDAAGVRQAVSIQAQLLNRMMDDFFAHRGLDQRRLRELIGHTPRQVLAGAVLGIVVGVVLG